MRSLELLDGLRTGTDPAAESFNRLDPKARFHVEGVLRNGQSWGFRMLSDLYSGTPSFDRFATDSGLFAL